MAITLTSTTDTPDQVRAAIEGKPAPEVPAETPVETPPAEPITVETPTPEPEKPKPAEPPAEPAEPKPAEEPPAEPKPEEKPAEKPEGPGTEAARALARLRWGREGTHNAEGRIAKLVAERNERDERIAELQRQLTERQAAPPPPPAPTPPAQPPAPAPAAEQKPRPKQDDFESFEQFTEALAEWKFDAKLADERKRLDDAVEARFRKEREAREAAEQRAVEDRQRQVFQEARAKAKARHADFDETMQQAANLQIGETAVRYVRESPLGPELAYFLAKNPDIADQVYQATPANALVRIGKIEAILEGELEETPRGAAKPAATAESDEPPTVPVSRAPSPAPRVEGGVVVPEKDPSKMTHAEYRAFREKQRKSLGLRAS